MDEILNELNSMKLPTRKPGVNKGDNSRANIIGGEGVDTEITAFVLGLVKDYAKPNLVPSRYNRVPKYRKLHILLKKLIKERDPDYKYTTIQINKDVETIFHTDKNNLGKSYCLSLGDFTGGALELKGKDDKILPINTKNRLVLYDGNIEHRTGKYKGNRY